MTPYSTSFKFEGTNKKTGRLDALFAFLAACMLVIAFTMSTDKAMAQEAGPQLHLPITMPVLNEYAGITPANFLSEVQSLVQRNNARDMVSLGKRAAELSLQIEDLQIKFLQSRICNSSLIPAQYGKEVQIGCDLLGAQAELNRIKQKALSLIGP